MTTDYHQAHDRDYESFSTEDLLTIRSRLKKLIPRYFYDRSISTQEHHQHKDHLCSIQRVLYTRKHINN